MPLWIIYVYVWVCHIISNTVVVARILYLPDLVRLGAEFRVAEVSIGLKTRIFMINIHK